MPRGGGRLRRFGIYQHHRKQGSRLGESENCGRQRPDLRLFRTLPDYYRALPGKLSDTLVAMDRAGASRTELAQAMGGLRGMRLGMLEGNTDEGYISVGAGIGNIHAITSVAEVVNQLAV